MTLDEDILLCDEKAKICRELAILYKDETTLQKTYYKNEGEYLRFKAYLKELKRLRESERRHGEWIYRGRAVSGLYHNLCPICKQDVISDRTNYCGNCGADMRKGGTE